MMHAAVFYAAAVWLTVLVAVCMARVVRARSTATRILALDTVVLMLVGMLALWSGFREQPFFLDAALALALLGFLGTLAATRFYRGGRLL